MPGSDLTADLRLFRESYRRKLPEKLALLEEKLRRARDPQEEDEPLLDAHRLAHSLKGTGGSYGFAEFSAELERIETQLDLMLQGTVADPAAAWREIDEALRRARESADGPRGVSA